MTEPAEYERVAEWLRALSPDARGDPGQDLDGDRRYGHITDTEGRRVLRQFLMEQRQWLVVTASIELDGIPREGRSAAQIAEDYHRKQVAQCAWRERAIADEVRGLEQGTFKGRAGDEHRRALARALEDRSLLSTQYDDVSDADLAAYWASKASPAGADFPAPVLSPGAPARARHATALARRAARVLSAARRQPR